MDTLGKEYQMALYLVQHGKCLSKEIDPTKSLSENGRVDVTRIAEVAARYDVKVNVIKHSGKKRARQTAEIFASFLKPPNGIETVEGMKPLDDVIAFSNHFSTNKNQMIVGHLPFMERLTNYLVAGKIDRRVFRFQNGGIVCLEPDPDTLSWFIHWTLLPEIK